VGRGWAEGGHKMVRGWVGRVGRGLVGRVGKRWVGMASRG
jgi:hypothetical protein